MIEVTWYGIMTELLVLLIHRVLTKNLSELIIKIDSDFHGFVQDQYHHANEW